ncbi:MAG TPA: LacI family DNA-binding transcriptional regulator, partial [Roseiflexaceae bacterium]|nr:LacI family DNA-binding transcriptional regulator [Roseiflexaceae bacterium]
KELGYVPNAHAQALARSSTSLVGVIVHDVSDPYFSEITRGIQNVASSSGRLVTFCNSYRDPAREMEYVRLLHAQRVEALIMAGSGLDDRGYSQAMADQIEAFIASGGRVAFIGRHNIPGDAVVPDNVGGARALGHLLADLGHRRIGVIGGPPLVTTSRDRLDGFRSGLRDYGITLAPEQIVGGDFSRDGGARAAIELIERDPELTAIFALNDLMAVGALAALRERAIGVPDRITVAGFDDIPLAADVTPALTTVRVPMIDMGARAMTLALQPNDSELRVEHLPTELIIRASSGPRR